MTESNLTQHLLLEYLGQFHTSYLDTADRLLPANVKDQLLRYPLIRGRVMGYVSTQLARGSSTSEVPRLRSKRRGPAAELRIFLPAHLVRCGMGPCC